MLRVWILCTPQARPSARAALALLSPSYAGAINTPYPSRTSRPSAAPAPPPELYWCGWQDADAVVTAVGVALGALPGVVVYRGPAYGPQSDADAKKAADYAAKDPGPGDVMVLEAAILCAERALFGKHAKKR